ncbi:MAG: hypothetical protein M3O26_08195 [Pseudomonadota bacterium]|nr:hypothetical protein [Pseudomonadota bacterium]
MESNNQLHELISETEKLLAKLADEDTPEIEKLRNKLGKSMAQAKDALDIPPTENGPSRHVKVRHVAASFNDYVRNYPWLALATGVLVASSIGILSTSATRRSMHH